MVVRLQTAEGEIEEHQTVCGVGGAPIGDMGSWYDKWVTKCGREWINVPEPHQECDHLECAIDCAENNIDEYQADVIGSIIIIIFIICLWKLFEHILILFFIFMFTLALSMFFYSVMLYKNEFNQLSEFRDKGTINGINAWKYESPHS
jgi:hypothetical protein